MEGSEESSSNDLVKITEGSATILFPNSNEVFYNPVQEFNRDLSVAVIRSFAKHLWTPTSKKKVRPKWTVPVEAAQTDPSDRNDSKDDTNGDSAEDSKGSSNEGKGEDDRGRDEGEGMEVAVRVTEDQLGELGEEGEGKEGGDMTCEYEHEHREEVKDKSEEQKEEEEEKEMDVDQRSDGGPGVALFKPVKQSGLRILEALAASGLRSVRYALEISSVESVVANDISEKAYQSMQRNIAYNNVKDRVFPLRRDASMLMYEHREPYTRFDVIDLDPYGSPSTFLDAAVQSVKDGGLLCVTCTDMSVLCGVRSETCHSKYGSTSIKAKYCHEMALRITLSSLESHANRYQRYIVPLLSCSVDFYIRIFVRIFTGAQEVKRSPSKLANIYHCIGCETFHLQPIGKVVEHGKSKKYLPATGPPVDRHCDQCDSIFRLGGPIWAAPIYDLDFVRILLKEVDSCPAGAYNTKGRIKGLLTVISEELISVPLYYELDSVCSTLHCDTPKMLALRSAILAQGFQVSLSHANPKAVKTSAPHNVFWDIMRCWVGLHEKKELSPTSPGSVILNKAPKIKADFDIRKDANPPSRLLKLTRFPENPESNWGPKSRAKRKGVALAAGASSKKQKKGQGKTEDKTKN